MNCVLCGNVVEAVSENWLEHHLRKTLGGDMAHIVANVAAAPAVPWLFKRLQ